MNKKKILADLIGYLVRKEFTVYEVLDAYYEESERHFFEDDLPEVTIPEEEQKNPYELEPLPCKFEGQREPTETLETLETLETEAETIVTEPETLETPVETEVTPETDFIIPPEMTLKEYRKTHAFFSYNLAKHYTVNGKTIEEYLKENGITVELLKSRLASKKWTFIKALTQKAKGFTHNNYAKVMPNGLTIKENLEKNGITPKIYSGRICHGEDEFSACTRPLKKYKYQRKKSTNVTGQVILPEHDVFLKELQKQYDGYFYEKFKNFILDGKTIEEHLKENNISPQRFYDRMNYKGWSIRKAAETKLNEKFDYDMVTDNGKTIRENLTINGIAKRVFLYRLKKGASIYEACTTSEYDMRSKGSLKGIKARKEKIEEQSEKTKPVEGWSIPKPADKLIGKDYDTVIFDTVPAEEQKSKKEPEPKKEYTLDDPPVKNIVPSNIPDLTIVDVCQNMKISMKRLKDRIDKGTFPKPDKGNKWSYAAVRFYFPNWG